MKCITEHYGMGFGPVGTQAPSAGGWAMNDRCCAELVHLASMETANANELTAKMHRWFVCIPFKLLFLPNSLSDSQKERTLIPFLPTKDSQKPSCLHPHTLLTNLVPWPQAQSKMVCCCLCFSGLELPPSPCPVIPLPEGPPLCGLLQNAL